MFRYICFVAILSVVSSNVALAGTCPPGLVRIEQDSTGRAVESKLEWKVSATNYCRCALTSLKMMCPKFLSSIKVKPPIVSIDRDGHCLMKREKPLYYGESIHFTYAWDPIQFQILNFNESCS